MPKKKAIRIDAFPELPNALQNVEETLDWEAVFQNDYPVTLELGCGVGDYSFQLAQKYPKRNFVGVDLKGARLYIGAKRAHDHGVLNIRYLRLHIVDIEKIVPAQSVEEIWIPFPDPFPKKPNKRLVARHFIEKYQTILEPNGIIHFKTDNAPLYEFALEILHEMNVNILTKTTNIHHTQGMPADVLLQTRYEKRHLANNLTSKYIAFQF